MSLINTILTASITAHISLLLDSKEAFAQGDLYRDWHIDPGMLGDWGKGPFGNIEMGGMFTGVKVRDHLELYDEDPCWYKHPEGTIAYRLDKA
jgi:hypothetical protein